MWVVAHCFLPLSVKCPHEFSCTAQHVLLGIKCKKKKSAKYGVKSFCAAVIKFKLNMGQIMDFKGESLFFHT